LAAGAVGVKRFGSARSHVSYHDGDEVDLLIERGDGAVVGFEVTAAARVPGDDMRALRKLREALGEAFVAGVALYTGSRT